MIKGAVLLAMRIAGHHDDRGAWGEVRRIHRIPERIAETAWDAGEARRLAGLPCECRACQTNGSTKSQVMS